MAFQKTWDETKPANTRSIRLGNEDMWEDKYAVRERANLEHVASAIEGGGDLGATVDTSGMWIHREGSARITVGLVSGLAGADKREGRMYFSSDTPPTASARRLWVYDAGAAAWRQCGAERHEDMNLSTYTTGTITASGTTWTLAGDTGWTSVNGVVAGCFIKGNSDGRIFEIASITNSTHLETTQDAGTIGSQTYTLYIARHPQYLARSGGTVDGPLTLSQNVTVAADKTVDGVDVGAHAHTGAAGQGVQLGVDSFADGIITPAKLSFVPGMICVGTYTGNGAANRAISITGAPLAADGVTERTPIAVEIYHNAYQRCVKNSSMAGEVYVYGLTVITTNDYGIRSLSAGKFNVGSTIAAGLYYNVNAGTYYYTAVF